MKEQKKQIIAVFCLSVVLLMMVGNSSVFLAARSKFQKPRFYIKLKGIGNLADGGDFGDFVDRNDIYFNDLNNSPENYDITVTTPPAYFRGFGGEIGLETKRYAVGISAGYIEKKFHLDYHFENEITGFEDNYVREHKFSAIPIFLLIHYKIINTSFFAASFTIGQGVYLGTYRDDREQTFKNYDKTFVNSYVESNQARLGFHLGTTLEIKITRNLGLFAEAAYRLVKFAEMEAKDYYEDDDVVNENEGDFYYWTNRRTDEAQFGIGENTRIYWDSILAELNLNGFSFSVGIKITFGSGKEAKPVKIAPQD
ncbi:MAG: hypothetical protein GTO45_28760 [Candidatus Aminicenantes bacterium]|nr:hypothetical protein [Candidatus Aminicenantes bacterium]NIN22166.1 hypothetical protein [Candidatus Aminicenantes bacterium]NIN41163.1 hypothetical protein [Candidatus Aminicenantes bacterium]NIN88762.1 hypothetical protein [Candidatus Aminicenantes bacterium]NIO85234.1 hypothetical protein [Candidatus Aminicenantes bacterium]